MWSLYEIIHIWTADVDESEEWSSQLIFQFKQLERRSLKKKQKKQGFNGIRTRDVTPHGRNELNKLTSLPMCGFIAQLVEHRTGIAEVTGSNPVEALIFFRLLLSNCLNWKINCDDHSSLSSFKFASKLANSFHSSWNRWKRSVWQKYSSC